MEFIKLPQKWSNLRTDCCTYLKNENGEPIKLKLKMKSSSVRQLIIRILLKTINDHSHFFKMFRIGQQKKEEINRSTQYTVKKNEDIIELSFFGIRKSTKEQAIKYIKESPNNIENPEQIYKENSSVVMLEITLFDQNNNPQDRLLQEIHVGKPVPDDIEILFYTPKTIYDGEITIYLKEKIKEDCRVILELHCNKQYQYISQPSKNVLVYNIQINDIATNEFKAWLKCDGSCSATMTFQIRRLDLENLKRKLGFGADISIDSKVCRILNDSNSESKTVDICADRKRQVNERLNTKIYREIAKTGHDFAFGKEVTDRMREIINTYPIVCILQDDIGDTPLNNAILKENEERAIELLDIISTKFPTEINARNTSDHTALILAVACDVSLGFIERLITCGADLMAADCDNKTAFNIAIQYQKDDVLRLLISEAISQKLFDNNTDILNSLLMETIDCDFAIGFQFLADTFETLRDESYCQNVLDSERFIVYKQFKSEHCHFDIEEMIPIMENLNENWELFLNGSSEN